MRKWLIILLILAAALAGIGIWLGQSASDGVPADGEIRIEVDNVL